MTQNTDTYLKPKKGEIYITKVRFSDDSNVKIRPLLIIFAEQGDEDVIGVFITSQTPKSAFDVTITSWVASGLEKPSIVRTSKPGTYHYSRLLKKIGDLNDKDLQKVLASFQELATS